MWIEQTSNIHDLHTPARELMRTLGVWLWIFEMCLIDWVVGNDDYSLVGCLVEVCLLFWWGVRGSSRQKTPARLRLTNRRNKGLNLSRSQDKPTLILTIPRSISKSSTKDLSLSVPERRLNVVLGRSLSLRVNTESGDYRRFPAQILTQRRSVIILQMVASGHWLFSQPHKPIV